MPFGFGQNMGRMKQMQPQPQMQQNQGNAFGSAMTGGALGGALGGMFGGGQKQGLGPSMGMQKKQMMGQKKMPFTANKQMPQMGGGMGRFGQGGMGGMGGSPWNQPAGSDTPGYKPGYGADMGPGGISGKRMQGADIPYTTREGDYDITSGGIAGNMSRTNRKTGVNEMYNRMTGQWGPGGLQMLERDPNAPPYQPNPQDQYAQMLGGQQQQGSMMPQMERLQQMMQGRGRNTGIAGGMQGGMYPWRGGMM